MLTPPRLEPKTPTTNTKTKLTPEVWTPVFRYRIDMILVSIDGLDSGLHFERIRFYRAFDSDESRFKNTKNTWFFDFKNVDSLMNCPLTNYLTDQLSYWRIVGSPFKIINIYLNGQNANSGFSRNQLTE
jgi:hypothetical protein